MFKNKFACRFMKRLKLYTHSQRSNKRDDPNNYDHKREYHYAIVNHYRYNNQIEISIQTIFRLQYILLHKLQFMQRKNEVTKI